MAVTRLTTKRVEKPWGRADLWPGFGDVEAGGEPVGEIWFEQSAGGDPDLLVKYLFTSEKLSIQVHPNDEGARAAGYPRGKSEAWVILAADPHAVIGVGMREVMTRDELRAAALDGTIEDLLDWRAVRAGDVFYSPAGTVHAIGPGLTLIEVQQNVDLTYRLYDYGRPRELHLDDGVAASEPIPYVAPYTPHEIAPGRTILVEAPAFNLERLAGGTQLQVDTGGRPAWLVPVTGTVRANSQTLEAGGVWLCDEPVALDVAQGGDLLLAYTGGDLVR